MNREIDHLMGMPLDKLRELENDMFSKWKRIRAVVELRQEIGDEEE